MTARVLAIVVTHNPRMEAFKISLRAIFAQADATVIIDNASSNLAEVQQAVDEISQLSSSPLSNNPLSNNPLSKECGGVVLAQTGNLGLGAAHNIGIAYARAHKFSHCLLLDQDSVPLPGMVQNLMLASKQKQQQPLSAVGATYLNADNGSESFFIRFGKLKFLRQYCAARDDDGCIEADFLISSGCLISLSAIDAIGMMDESLFIDHVDTEWFLRARSKGFRAFGVCNAVMQHGLGERTHRVKLRRQRNVPQHQPFRYYYIFRNSIILYKRRYVSLLWIWNDVQRLVMVAIMFALLRAPRWQNTKMMARGIVDGVRGVAGRVDLG